jgi:hypothetical protein
MSHYIPMPIHPQGIQIPLGGQEHFVFGSQKHFSRMGHEHLEFGSGHVDIDGGHVDIDGGHVDIDGGHVESTSARLTG